MSYGARRRRPARRALLPALAVGGIAALAVAAPAMATLPPGGTGAVHSGLVELDGEISGQGPFKILFTGSEAFLTNFPAGSQTGTVHHLTRRGAESPFFSGTLEYRRGRTQLTLTQLRVRVDFQQGNALTQAFAINTRPITFPDRLVEGPIPNAPANTAAALRNNHYKCYSVVRYSRRPRNSMRVTVTDRIQGARPERDIGRFPFNDILVGRAREVCIPVEKRLAGDTSTVLDNRLGTNLVAYDKIAPKRVSGSPLRLSNQFGGLQVTPGTYHRVLAPSQILFFGGPRVVPPPAPASNRIAGSPDHFACYRADIRDQRGPRPSGLMRLTDRFERKTHRFLGRPPVNDFCNPADLRFRAEGRLKQRRWPIKHPEANLTSYRLPQSLRRQVFRTIGSRTSSRRRTW